MPRTLIICLTLVVLAAFGRCFAAESTITVAPATAGETMEMNQALDSLRGVSGLEGGNSQDMQAFLNMVQTPGMVEVVKKLNAQLATSGEADLGDIDKFVRENITPEDVEKLLGYKVKGDDLQKALNNQTSPEDMQTMLDLMAKDSKPGK